MMTLAVLLALAGWLALLLPAVFGRDAPCLYCHPSEPCAGCRWSSGAT